MKNVKAFVMLQTIKFAIDSFTMVDFEYDSLELIRNLFIFLICHSYEINIPKYHTLKIMFQNDIHLLTIRPMNDRTNERNFWTPWIRPWNG